MNRNANSRSRAGKRNATACEHCRAAKARCQPSEQPGVCQKCFVARRECISRTKARPRRARPSPTPEEAKFKSQPSTQPATFTIATFLPARSHRDDEYEDLREIHRHAFTNALDDEDFAQETPNSSLSAATPSVTSTTARAAADIWRSGSVQKHSLYDDEFLKILGLKYVSGGDGSLELLRGLLIYCAWYPFHLKPKNSQLARCMRMAAGIVRDLNLDDDFLAFQPWEQGVRADDLDKIRTYLAYVYLESTYIVVWKGDRFVNTRQPPWTTTAIDILEQYAETNDDRKLAILARVSTLFAEAAGAVNGRDSAKVRSSQLILVSLSQQYQQTRDSYSVQCPGVLDDVTIRLQIMYLEIYLDVGSLLAFPVAKTALSAKRTRFAPPTAKINSSVKKLGAFLHLVAELDDADMLAFTVNDWTRLIIILTWAFRLSFPLALAPEFDWLSARKEIRLEQFLSEVSRGGGEAAASSGILAANRVVLGVLGSKYSQRERALAETAPLAAPPNRSAGCPVMGGSGGVTIAQWDLGLGDGPELSTDPDMADMLPMLHNMWATGGIAWQDVGKIPWDLFGDQVGGDVNSWALQ